MWLSPPQMIIVAGYCVSRRLHQMIIVAGYCVSRRLHHKFLSWRVAFGFTGNAKSLFRRCRPLRFSTVHLPIHKNKRQKVDAFLDEIGY
jgi:hypothetical protein